MNTRATILVVASLWGGFVLAQPAAPQRAPGAHSSTHAASSPRANGSKSAAPQKISTRPAWRELSPGQQQALQPLAAQWDTLNEAQKRKWLAMSANFPKLSAEEQAKLHSRMTEWVALSPQQRTAARLNYGETRKLAPDDKKAKWEAYQALPPEEKKKLAAGAPAPKPPSTAAAVRPVSRDKLATLPRTRASHDAKTPRIAAAPNQVDHNTLLPQPVRLPPPIMVQPAPAAPAAPQPLPPQAGTPD